MAVVAAEQLVATLAGQRDRDPTPCPASQVERRHGRGVGERLAVVVDEIGKHLDQVGRLDDLLVVDRAERGGDLTCVRTLVVACLGEADRERLDVPRARGDRLGQDEARVDATAEEHAERDVGDEPLSDRQQRALVELLERLVIGEAQLRLEVELPVALAPELPGRGPREGRSRLELDDAAEDRQRRGHVAVLEVGAERVGVDLTEDAVVQHQRSQLRREAERPVGVVCHVQRLLAEPVAREDQLSGAVVPQGEREHPVELADEPRAPLLVGMRDHLAVGAGGERVPVAREALAQLDVAVDLAVEDDVDRAVLVAIRLMPAGDVDDRQPTDRERDPVVVMDAGLIGAAVHDRGRDLLQQFPPARGLAR